MNAALALVGLVAAGLAGVVAVELWPAAPAADPAAPRSLSRNAPASPDRPDPGTAWIDLLLARPLFSQSRRPPTAVAAAGRAVTAAAPLPRMTAILIDGTRRSVIFAAPGGKPISLGEGGRLGAFTVQSIEPQRVVVLGPDGPRTVRTSFDPAAPAPLPTPLPAAPLFPGIALPNAGSPPFIPPVVPQGMPPGAAR